jgi:hypothetical protein
VPVRAMFSCVAAACHRLTFAPGDEHVVGSMRWRWAGCVMERVTRGRGGKVQGGAAARAACALRFYAHCSKHWLVFGCVESPALQQPHQPRSPPFSRLVFSLLLLPAYLHTE